MLVVSGSAKTEDQYFRGLRSYSGNRAIDLTLVNRPKDPADVVRYAIGYARRAATDFDEVWCVFDVDDFDIAAAVRLADTAGLRLAVSNPCFELWLLLHHADCRGHCAGYADVVARLRRHVPAYDKTRLDFRSYVDGVGDAVKRARDLDTTGVEHQRNPSTGVWRLVETIMEK